MRTIRTTFEPEKVITVDEREYLYLALAGLVLEVIGSEPVKTEAFTKAQYDELVTLTTNLPAGAVERAVSDKTIGGLVPGRKLVSVEEGSGALPDFVRDALDTDADAAVEKALRARSLNGDYSNRDIVTADRKDGTLPDIVVASLAKAFVASVDAPLKTNRAVRNMVALSATTRARWAA